MRRFLTVGIVGTWVLMATLLVQKHSRTQNAVGAPLLPPAAQGERDEWFGVYREGTKIGHAHRVTARTPGGHAFDEESVVALAMLGVPQTIRTSLVAETDDTFALRRIHFTLVSPATVFSVSGTTDGHQLRVRYGAQGREASLDVPLTEPIYLPSTLRPRVLAGDLTPGTRYTVPVFSPLTMRNEPLTVTVEGRESLASPAGPVDALRLAEEHQGIRTHAWLDPAGDVVREEAALGFTLERETRDRALTGAQAGGSVDLVAASRIPLAGRIEDPRQAERLTLRVHGSATDRIPNDPPRQRIAADLLRIAREDLPAVPPALVANPGQVPTSALAAYVAPAPFIESDDAAIVAQAHRIVGDAADVTTAARRLVAWVNENVTKAPTVTVPSAREVLASRRGDCNEHAVLLTALARAAGLPARVVAGAVYAGDGFYYHAWTEVWLGQWVSADGVFGQLPVDATHVKLIEGGPERHMALASVIGQLTFAVEEVR